MDLRTNMSKHLYQNKSMLTSKNINIYHPRSAFVWETVCKKTHTIDQLIGKVGVRLIGMTSITKIRSLHCISLSTITMSPVCCPCFSPFLDGLGSFQFCQRCFTQLPWYFFLPKLSQLRLELNLFMLFVQSICKEHSKTNFQGLSGKVSLYCKY